MVDIFYVMYSISYKYSKVDIFWLRIYIVLWIRDINNMLDYVFVWIDEFEKIIIIDYEWRLLFVWSIWIKVVLFDFVILSIKIYVGCFDCFVFWLE